MNYTEAKFDMFWAYGPRSLDHWRGAGALVQQALDSLLAVPNDATNLVIKANLFETRVKVKGTKKANYSVNRSVSELLKNKTLGLAECGIYVYDETFSPTQSPRVLLNFHTVDVDEIAGRRLELPQGGGNARTFLLFAMAHNDATALTLGRAAVAACSSLTLSYGYVFQNVGYKYDGVTPLEWAYKNHSAKLRSGTLADLCPSEGERLNV